MSITLSNLKNPREWADTEIKDSLWAQSYDSRVRICVMSKGRSYSSNHIITTSKPYMS